MRLRNKVQNFLPKRYLSLASGSVRSCALVTFFFVFFLFGVDTSFASASSDTHTPSFLDLKWFWINFLIYIALLYFLVKGKAVAAWNTRVLRIQAAVNKGKSELTQANERLQTAKSKLATLEADIERVKRDILRETEVECRNVVEEAQAKAKKMLVQADDLIKTEGRLLEKSLQDEITKAVLLRARQKLEKELNIESDRHFREKAISGLSELIQ